MHFAPYSLLGRIPHPLAKWDVPTVHRFCEVLPSVCATHIVRVLAVIINDVANPVSFRRPPFHFTRLNNGICFWVAMFMLLAVGFCSGRLCLFDGFAACRATLLP